MGLSEILARFAVRVAQVLVVESPGQWATRVELEQQMLRRGWRSAWTPADADVLAVCGAPGPELAELVDRLWGQMPGPRVRADITSPAAVNSALDDAAALLLDTSHHRTDAQERAQKPQTPAGTDHGGQGAMDHGEMDHGEMDHGEMDMAPEGIPLAEGGEDRDGLGMDVLHVRLGPVLPYWPAGLVLHCSLQGDVVVEAEVQVLDAGTAAGTPVEAGAAKVPSAAVRCDNLMSLLALAGLVDAAACARAARDAVLAGDQDTAVTRLGGLHRTLARSRLLRWSLRGVLRLDDDDVGRHGLPDRVRGDAHDRMLSLLGRALAELEAGDGGSPTLIAVESLPHLVTGLDLAVVRLAVASLDLDPFPADQEVIRA